MFQKRITGATVVLVLLCGAGTLVAQQQTPPSGVTQATVPSAAELMAKGSLDRPDVGPRRWHRRLDDRAVWLQDCSPG